MGQQLLPLEQLGGPARALRAFRRLLFLEPAELEGSPLLRELPRPEVRLPHFLFWSSLLLQGAPDAPWQGRAGQGMGAQGRGMARGGMAWGWPGHLHWHRMGMA